MKKGFTLIELLAVIVILAIIAVIAVPIVLNIIEDSKNNSTLRSADFYLDAAEYSIAQAIIKDKKIENNIYDILENGNICLEYTDLTCTDELIVDVKGEMPKSGTIIIEDGKIAYVSLNLNNKIIATNSKGELVYVKTFDELCKYISGTPKTAGAKYECKVDPNKDPYTFYVLTTPNSEDTSINLIMDTNINSDGTSATKDMPQSKKETNNGVYNSVSWISSQEYLLVGGSPDDWSGWTKLTIYGPITAVQFLYNATKDWTNLEPLNYIYKDRALRGISEDNTITGYISLISINGVATITSLPGDKTIIGTKDVPLRARMPISLEVASKTESNAYLYNNPSDLAGYWTLSSANTHSSIHVRLRGSGIIYWEWSGVGSGIRPVITLNL